MSDNNKEEKTELTEEGRLVVQLTKSFFAQDIDEAFRTIGRYMDKHNLSVSHEVIEEYITAQRISAA